MYDYISLYLYQAKPFKTKSNTAHSLILTLTMSLSMPVGLLWARWLNSGITCVFSTVSVMHIFIHPMCASFLEIRNMVESCRAFVIIIIIVFFHAMKRTNLTYSDQLNNAHSISHRWQISSISFFPFLMCTEC